MPTLMLRDSLISYDGALETYKMPPVIRRIAANAFYDSGRLTTLTIPDSVVDIGDYAFKMCYNLTEIRLPVRVDRFGIGVFQQCRKLLRIDLPEGVAAIDAGMLICCDSLRTLTIPDSIRGIAANAFATCHELSDIRIAPALLELLPEGRRDTAAITFMHEHSEGALKEGGRGEGVPDEGSLDAGCAEIDRFVRDRVRALGETILLRNDREALDYLIRRDLLTKGDSTALAERANQLKRTELAAMLLEAGSGAAGEDPFGWDPFA